MFKKLFTGLCSTVLVSGLHPDLSDWIYFNPRNPEVVNQVIMQWNGRHATYASKKQVSYKLWNCFSVILFTALDFFIICFKFQDVLKCFEVHFVKVGFNESLSHFHKFFFKMWVGPVCLIVGLLKNFKVVFLSISVLLSGLCKT